MTVIVLDPSTLHDRLPNASPEAPVRVRVLVQTVAYDYSSAILVASPINHEHPNDTITLDLAKAAITKDVGRRGTLVSIYANYTGAELQVIECVVEDETALLQPESRQIMQRISSLQDLK